MAQKKTSMVDDLLSGTRTKTKHTSAQMHNYPDTQLPEDKKRPDRRINPFIRGDLAAWIDDEVHRRKQDVIAKGDQSEFKGKDTLRAVVEEALEAFSDKC